MKNPNEMNAPVPKDPIKVVREKDDEQYQDGVTCSWTGYLNGHWSQERPKRIGRYLVADKFGNIAGYVTLTHDPATGEVQPNKDWDGWWWSFPLPPPPVSPPKEWPESKPHLRLVKN